MSKPEFMNSYEIEYCHNIIEEMKQSNLFKEFFLKNETGLKQNIVNDKQKLTKITLALINNAYSSTARWIQDMRSFFQSLSDDFRADSLSYFIVQYFCNIFEEKVKFIPKSKDDDFINKFTELQDRAKVLLETIPKVSA